MTRPVVLAVSPHLDDAAFSCGGTLSRLARDGRRVLVATLFTRSVPRPTGFALACQTDKGLGPDIDYMALRREEDAVAMAALGCEPKWLDFPEAPHRGYASAAALFEEPHAEDAIGEALAATIADLAATHEPILILAPQAIGGHVDHVQVVRALEIAAPPAPIAWWEDFPYSVRDGDPKQPFSASFQALASHDVALATADMAAKREACLAYASQLDFQFGGAVGLERRLSAAGPSECLRGAPLP